MPSYNLILGLQRNALPDLLELYANILVVCGAEINDTGRTSLVRRYLAALPSHASDVSPCVWQERWAVPGAELASSKGIPIPEAASEHLVLNAADSKAEDETAATGPKRFLPFSIGPRQ